jgi:uncharacterized protein (UPF0147 family)
LSPAKIPCEVNARGTMMNANPQAAAEQVRETFRHVTAQLGHLGLDAAVPEGVRALAEKAVAQTAKSMTALRMLSMHP